MMISDKMITDNVIQALLWDARVSPSRIVVKTKNGHVTLSGTVDNFHKKWSALDNALKISGVDEVIDDIKVKPNDSVDDAVLQDNIQKAISNDSRLEQLGIFCSVLEGCVSLSGKVNTYYQKLAAEESCRWVKGVVNVENEIEVVPKGKDHDQNIKKRIEDQIEQNIRSNSEEIIINVENGIVLLTGRVTNSVTKIYAETLASMVSNVSYVKNDLIVSKKS
jgi:osmotically-inducible protein OsmY